jgi:hypothetical protein
LKKILYIAYNKLSKKKNAPLEDPASSVHPASIQESLWRVRRVNWDLINSTQSRGEFSEIKVIGSQMRVNHKLPLADRDFL